MSNNPANEKIKQQWIDIQHKTFTAWINTHLMKKGIKITDLITAANTSIPILTLLEILTNKKCPFQPKQNPNMRIHKLQNAGIAIEFAKNENVKLVGIQSEHFVDGNLKYILGYVWTIILKFQIDHVILKQEKQKIELSKQKQKVVENEEKIEKKIEAVKNTEKKLAPQESIKVGNVETMHAEIPEEKDQLKKYDSKPVIQKSAKQKLIDWVNSKVQPFLLNCTNFTHDWKDGKLLSALICSLKKKALNYFKVKDFDPLKLIKISIETAEKSMNIPKIIDAEDINKDPEELSLMTYISYFFNYELDHFEEEEEEKEEKDEEKIDLKNCNVLNLKNYVIIHKKENFQIEIKDSEGNFIQNIEKNPFEFVFFPEEENSITIEYANPSKNQKGIFDVEYFPKKENKYRLNITLNSENINGAPFTINVVDLRFKFDIEEKIFNKSFERNSEIPLDLKFLVTDSKNNPIDFEFTDKILVQNLINMKNEKKIELNFEKLKNQEGIFVTKILPEFLGENLIEFLFDSKKIDENKFFVVEPLKSINFSLEIKDKEKKKINNKIEMEIKNNSKNEQIKILCDIFDIKIKCEENLIDKKLIDFNIKEGKNKNEFFFDFIPKSDGNYEISVSFQNENILNSPFNFVVAEQYESIDFALDENLISLLKTNLFVGKSANLIIKDVDNKIVDFSNINFDISISKTNSDIIDFNIEQNEDQNGLKIVFTPDEETEYLFDVVLSNQSIKNCPLKLKAIKEFYPVDFKVFIDDNFKFLTDKQNKIEIKCDKSDVDLNKIKFDISLMKDKEKIDFKIEKNKENPKLIDICFVPRISGDYQFEIKLENENISNSPIEFTVSDEIVPECFNLKCENKKIPTGKEFEFQVFTEKKNINISNCEFDIYVTHENKPLKFNLGEKDNKLVISFIPEKEGEYNIGVSIQNADILNSPINLTAFVELKPNWFRVLNESIKDEICFKDIQSEFSITSIEKNKVKDIKDVNFDISVGNDDEKIKFDVSEDSTKEKLKISFIPTNLGEFEGKVLYNNEDIIDSPFHFIVKEKFSNEDFLLEKIEEENILKNFIGDTIRYKIFPVDSKKNFNLLDVNFLVDVIDEKNNLIEGNLNESEDKKSMIFDFNPIISGTHKITVKIENEHIKKSPSELLIHSKPDPKFCLIYGDAFDKKLTINNETSFRIKAKGKNNEDLKYGGDNFKVNICNMGKNQNVNFKLIDEKNGSYLVTFTPDDSNDYQVSVKFEEIECGNGPFKISATSEIYPPKCFATGSGVDPIKNIPKKIPSFFKIQSRDQTGKNIEQGGHEYFVEIISNYSGKKVVPKIKDNNNGMYEVCYVPVEDSPHIISVSLNEEEIQDSPFIVNVKTESDPSKTEAYGDGLLPIGHFVDVETNFIIQSKDENGDAIPTGGDKFDIIILDEENEQTCLINQIDNNDGSYKIFYTPKKSGNHKISIKINNQDIKNSPFKVYIDAPPFSKNCRLIKKFDRIPTSTPFSFSISSYDKFGKVNKIGGNKFISVILNEKGNEIPSFMIDNNDGTYTCKFAPENNPGKYKATIKFNDEPITDCPFEFLVTPQLSELKSYAEGQGLIGADISTRKGIPSIFKIFSRDSNGNPYIQECDDEKIEKMNKILQRLIDFQDLPFTLPESPVLKKSLSGKSFRNLDVKNQPENKEENKQENKPENKPENKTNDREDVYYYEKIEKPSTKEIEIKNQLFEEVDQEIFDESIPFEIEIFNTDDNNQKIDFKAYYYDDGEFLVFYYPKKAGQYKINILFDNKHIKDSPFYPIITEGIDPLNCIIEGPALNKVYNSKPTYLKIIPKDKKGRNVKIGGEAFQIICKGPNGKPSGGMVMIDDPNTGIYSTSFIPKHYGTHTVEIKYNGYQLKNSPFKVYARDASDSPKPNKCIWKQITPILKPNSLAQFLVHLRNDRLRDLKSGNDDVDCTIITPSNKLIRPEIIDHYNGKYTCQFNPDETGNYNIDITVMGESIEDSPFNINVLSIIGSGCKVKDWEVILKAESIEEKDLLINVNCVSNKEENVKIKPNKISKNLFKINYDVNNPKPEEDYNINIKVNNLEVSNWIQMLNTKPFSAIKQVEEKK